MADCEEKVEELSSKNEKLEAKKADLKLENQELKENQKTLTDKLKQYKIALADLTKIFEESTKESGDNNRENII